MHNASVEEVVGRLNRLERENRVMKWLVVLLAAVVAIIGLVGATLKRTPAAVEEIRARRFVLVDHAGKQRGLWAVFRDTVDLETFELKPHDMVALDMRSRGNTARIAVSSDSAGFSLSSLTGARSLTLMRSDGRVSTSMWRSGSGPQETAALRVRPDGSAGLLLHDAEGKPRMNLSLATDGSPYLSFFDERERPSIALEGSATTRRLVLADQSGAVRLALSTLSSGRPVVLLLDAKGNQRAQISVLKDGSPSIALFDEDKGVVWHEP